LNQRSLASFEHEIGARIGRADWDGAAQLAADCRGAWPNDASGWLFGSLAALLAGQPQEALRLSDERLVRDPANVQCLLQRAESLFALGHREEALAAAAEAGGHAKEDAAAWEALAGFYVQADAHASAAEALDRALAVSPQETRLLAKRAAVHRFAGDFVLAERDNLAILARSPADADALKELTELSTQTKTANHIPALEAALRQAPQGSEQAAALNFALAKSYEDLGDYTASWQHLTVANRLEHARTEYDAASDRAAFEGLMRGFATVEPERQDPTGEQPIFIVGLPRSGTTLVDRILGSHSAVHSAGERPALSGAINRAVQQRVPQMRGWAQYVAALPALEGEPIAREYLAQVQSYRGTRPRFTDKQPANFFYCALILRAFPRAQIVHVTRSPLASCYAIYKNRFPGTFAFANDLRELGDFYIGYHRLMAHWHRVLPGRIVDVAYEDIVTQQEVTTRDLLERLGIPFEEACLHFELNPAPTVTASSVQVRRPLYDTSLEQWRNFSAQLAPLRSQLEAAGIVVE
jgi:tetratricopeptide (TPR) repeat protein